MNHPSGPGRVESGSAQPVAIWPDARTLPANILRFYVEFDRAAEASFDRSLLKLLDDSGREVASPFLVFTQELWSPDSRLLTVLLDPARIKRNLGGGPERKPAIREGGSYRFVAEGGDVKLSVQFYARAAVFTALDEHSWTLEIPCIDSLEPLVIRFDRVMDSALCEEEIALLAADGNPIAGHLRLADEGCIGYFFPDACWSEGEYCVTFSALLEDVCGNRLGEALDHVAGTGTEPRAGSIRFVV